MSKTRTIEFSATSIATRVFAAKNVQQRRIFKTLKKYVAPIAVLVVALTTACAPLAQSGRVTTTEPSAAARSQFIIHFDRTAFDAKGDITTKLESLSRGQHLAIEFGEIAENDESVPASITIDSEMFDSLSDMPSQVLASIASEMGIMSVTSEDGILLASAGLTS